MKSIISEFRVWRNERRKRLQGIKAANDALWGVYFDKGKLMDIIDECNRDPDLVINVYTADGTRIEIRTQRGGKKRAHWDD